jgi:hypothetical protein
MLAEAARQQAQALFERRRALVAELDALAKTEAAALPELEAAAAHALEEFRRGEVALAELRQAANEAAVTAHNERTRLTHRRDRLTNELERSAPEEIARLEVDLRDADYKVRDSLTYSEIVTSTFMDGSSLRGARGNMAAIDEARAAIRAGLDECAALRQQATPPDELARRLAEIRQKALSHLATD